MTDALGRASAAGLVFFCSSSAAGLVVFSFCSSVVPAIAAADDEGGPGVAGGDVIGRAPDGEDGRDEDEDNRRRRAVTRERPDRGGLARLCRSGPAPSGKGPRVEETRAQRPTTMADIGARRW
ncbi:hypothetical protein CDD83_9412 [Cordyceps sp. RAO-2017]|nr:hypothetical protein CDD83_9412 [Cordyceps sp. RAO-2017]